MASKVWMPDIDKTMVGNAWRYEGVLDVDWALCPWQEAKELGKHSTKKLSYSEFMAGMKALALKSVDPEFHKKVQPGDFLIGGGSTGYGHDHEQGPIALRAAGIAAVLCEGTNVNFRRNSIHQGLPVIVIKGIMSSVKTGDRLAVNLVQGTVENMTTQQRFTFKPWPSFILDIMREGGLYPWLREDLPAESANIALK